MFFVKIVIYLDLLLKHFTKLFDKLLMNYQNVLKESLFKFLIQGFALNTYYLHKL